MIELAYPYMLLLALLVVPMRFVEAYRQVADGAIQVPFFKQFQHFSKQQFQTGTCIVQKSTAQKWMLTTLWLALVFAAAKPQLLGEPLTQYYSARDLMVAVDLSGSMAVEDFTISPEKNIDRLSALKQLLKQFLSERKHDRLGLIVFGDAPYLQVPFTSDHSAWLTLLNETEVAMAGQSTVIGDAIGLSIKLFRQSTIENRVLIIFTDGNDTDSHVPPIDAAKVAKAYGIKIYCVAMGDANSINEQAVDINTLQRIAEITGGEFYQAFEPNDLKKIHQHISQLEPELFDTVVFYPKKSLHHYIVAACLGLVLMYYGGCLFRVRYLGASSKNKQAY